MRKAILVALVVFAANRPTAQTQIDGVWQGQIQPGVFWTIELKRDGSTLTGAVNDTIGDSVEIYEGVMSGNTVTFKATSQFGQPTITFTGTMSGNEIAFTREIQGQGPPGPIPAIMSPTGVRQFTVERVAAGQAPIIARGTPVPRRLIVYDRQGKVTQSLGEADNYNWPVFSPDGTKLVARVRGHLWVFNLSTGRRTRLTSPPWLAFAPAWSADGHQMTYFSWRQQSAGGVYRKASDGSGAEEKLYESERGASVIIRDLSLDGRWLSFDSGNVLFALPLAGDRKAVQLAPGESSMRRAHFSPDGRFLAYESDETGRYEVFVRPFDSATGKFSTANEKWQISKGGGGMGYWRRDGKELIYLGSDGGVRAVDVRTTPAFTVGIPHLLFRVPDTVPPLAACFCLGEKSLGAVSPDGQRFAFSVPQVPPRNEVTVASGTLSKYGGTYKLFDADVKIAIEDGRLMATGIDTIGGDLAARDRAQLVAGSDSSFFVKDATAEIDFVTDPSGNVTHFLFYQSGVPTKAPRE